MFSMDFSMAHSTKPYDSKWVFITCVMMSMWYAFCFAVVTLVRSFYFVVSDSMSKFNSSFLFGGASLFRVSNLIPSYSSSVKGSKAFFLFFPPWDIFCPFTPIKVSRINQTLCSVLPMILFHALFSVFSILFVSSVSKGASSYHGVSFF